jgi:uroporphyrinogen-III synthase
MKIAITRLLNKAAGDQELCARYGHECTTVSPLRSNLNMDRVQEFTAAADRGEFDCIFFTSALPAEIIAPLLKQWPRVIAIGPKTAETLKKYGIDSETLPTFYSRDLVPYLGSWIKNRTIGIPRADVPNPTLIDGIRNAGGRPYEVRVYTLVPTEQELQLDGADALLFTSAMSFKKAVWQYRPGLLLIAIGEVTAEAMQEGGHAPDVIGDGSLEGTLRILNSRYDHGKGLQ